MSDYDVIVIGSGAGGGTLAHRLAPSGKRILLLERGDWLPREPQNWSAADVFVDGRYVSPDTWYDADGKPFQPQVHYYVGGATKLYGAALYRLREEDFGELAHHDGISPAWPSATTSSSPTTRRPSSSTRCTASAARTRRNRPPARLPVPGGHPRAAHPAALRRPRGGRPASVPCALRRACSTSGHAQQPLHPLRDLRRLPVPRAREVRRRGARRSGPRWSTTTSRCHERAVVRLETNAAGTEITGVVLRDGEELLGRHRRRVLRRGQRRRCCSASANARHPQGSPTAPVRSAATTCSTTARPCSRCRRSPTRRCSRRRSESTTSTSARRSGSRWGTSRWSASRGGHVPRRAAGADQARAVVVAARRRASRGRLLAVHGGPPAAGEPRDAAADGGSAGYTADQRRPKEQLSTELKGLLGPPRHASAPPAPAPRVPQERDPAGRRRAPGGTCRFGTDPRPRCSTRTAAPTRSTTSTSSTPASSLASAPSTRR